MYVPIIFAFTYQTTILLYFHCINIYNVFEIILFIQIGMIIIIEIEENVAAD